MELVGLRCKILIIGVVDDWILQRMSPRGGGWAGITAPWGADAARHRGDKNNLFKAWSTVFTVFLIKNTVKTLILSRNNAFTERRCKK